MARPGATGLNVEGVVLRRWESGEADRRIALLTKERGKIYAVARGARKARSKLAAVTEPLMQSQMELAVGRSNTYITQAQPLSAFGHLRDDYTRLLCGLALAEALDAVLPRDEPQQEAFELCIIGLHAIEAAKEPLGALLWADLALMHIAGFAPEFGVSVVSGRTIRGKTVMLSPSAGGVVLAGEGDARDVFEVPREIAVTLSKLSDLPSPPDYVKRAAETARALLPFWFAVAGRDLPARSRLLGEESGQ